MKDFGEIPGGKNELKPLLFPFHRSYPLKLWSKYRWFINSKLRLLLQSINSRKKWLTVIDRLGAPGDALITANIIRCIKNHFPQLKINCITAHPELIRLDPNIDSINQPESFFSFDSSYWELIVNKKRHTNIIKHNLDRLGLKGFNYKASFYLSEEEKEWAAKRMLKAKKPLIAICTKSKEQVKNWPEEKWFDLIENLKNKFTVIQLGDNREPYFENVIRFAGKLTMRESAALLSKAGYFIGPDSLLMHIANGLKIRSTIIFGGSRPIDCFGYSENVNLSNAPECSPCWIHEGYESCDYNLKCLFSITVEEVINSLDIVE
mgnify:CR=1 FL=1